MSTTSPQEKSQPTTLETLRLRALKQLEDKFVPYLLDRAVYDHTRHHWQWCDCSYCLAKARGTQDIDKIMNTYDRHSYHDRYDFLHQGYGRRNLAYEAVKSKEKRRDELHQELNALKQQVI